MLHNLIHILLGIAVLGTAVLLAWALADIAKTFRAEGHALQTLLTALKSQAVLLAAIVKHIEKEVDDELSKALEQYNAEGKPKH